jgi:hypothetical protein
MYKILPNKEKLKGLIMKSKKDQIGSRDSGQMFIIKFYNRKSKANRIGLLRIGFYT